MHVTAVVPKYPPFSRVGAWLATHSLLRSLVARGHTVEVVTSLERSSEGYRLGGVRVLPSSYLANALDRADVVVSHLGDGGITHRKAKALRKPSVVMVHSSKTTDTRVLGGAALVVCNSFATEATLARYLGRKIVVRPYTDPSLYKTVPGDKVTLINLSSAKGGDVFWRVARLMPDVQFLGVRGGYGNQVVHDLPNVEVIGPTGQMRDEVYRRTKLLLMPSMSESWGMTAAEAACSGIPVLAKPTEGLRECLGRAGTWVDSTSTSLWKKSINDILQPEAWEAASEASFQRSRELARIDDRPIFTQAVESLV